MTTIDDAPTPGDSAPVSHLIVVSRSRSLAARIGVLLEGSETIVSCAAPSDAQGEMVGVPDMLVLDAAPPSHLEAADMVRLRRRWPSALLVVVGAPGEQAATTLLDAGADDVIESEAGWPHAVARLNAAVRRTRLANAMLRRRVGDVVYDRDNRRVWCAGEEVVFAPRELEVLDALWIRAGEVVRHDSLHDYVWAGADDGDRSNRLEVYISYIRRKLQRSKEVMIQNMRGIGYRLVLRRDAGDGE